MKARKLQWLLEKEYDAGFAAGLIAARNMPHAGTMVSTYNEDRVSATNAPGPLDANEERRNG